MATDHALANHSQHIWARAAGSGRHFSTTDPSINRHFIAFIF